MWNYWVATGIRTGQRAGVIRVFSLLSPSVLQYKIYLLKSFTFVRMYFYFCVNWSTYFTFTMVSPSTATISEHRVRPSNTVLWFRYSFITRQSRITITDHGTRPYHARPDLAGKAERTWSVIIRNDDINKLEPRRERYLPHVAGRVNRFVTQHFRSWKE